MPGRRPLFAFVALLTLPLSACLHISASMGPTPREQTPKLIIQPNDPPQPQKPSQSQQDKFASLSKMQPGNVVPVHPKSPKQPEIQPTSNPPGPFPPVGQLTPPPDPPLLAAVRAYAENHPERAIEILRSLDKQQQDFVLSVLPILVRGANADLTQDAAAVGMLVDQLNSVAMRLEPRAALRLENFTFCKEDSVEGFGRYLPQGKNEPYRPNTRAQFYLEVKNLGSRPSDREFITHIHATFEIRDSHDKPVEMPDADNYKRRVPVVRFDRRLVSHAPLRDFHVAYLFPVPTTPGVYKLTVEIRDATTGRTAKTNPIEFCVAGP